MSKRKVLFLAAVVLVNVGILAAALFGLFRHKSAVDAEQEQKAGLYSKSAATILSSNEDSLSSGERSKLESEEQGKPSHLSYSELSTQNPDYLGWVTVAGTNLDYPVMAADSADPEFYLTHDFDREKTEFGVPFLDSRCSADSDNLIVYGHHTAYGTMFSALHGYKAKSFWKEHPTVSLELADGTHVYEIFAVLTAKGEYTDTGWSIFKCIDMSEDEFQAMLEEISLRRLYSTGITPSYGDRLLTLVTCEYSQDNGRLVVLAREQT